MKSPSLRLGSALACAALLCACQMDGPAASSAASADVVYSVDVDDSEHGSVIPVPARAVEGTDIKIVVDPDPGYKLGSLKWHSKVKSNLDGSNQTDVNQNSQNVYRIEMPERGAWLTAYFVPVGTAERSVSLDVGDHGSLIATPVSGSAGATVRLYSFLEPGYAFKDGYPSLSGGTWVAGREGYEFTISGGGNVTVSALFERPSGAGSLIASARAAMAAKEYDAAFAYYESAYQVDRTDEEAILYSAIGELLGIAIDPKVRVLLRKPGMQSTSTAGTLNDLLDLSTDSSMNWLASYRDDGGKEYKLPRLGAPSKTGIGKGGFVSAFLNLPIYRTNVGKRQLFDVLLLWNMLANNLDGFNGFVDDALECVFGSKFEDACARAASMPEGAAVSLDPGLKALFGLDDLYGPGATTVGREELVATVSALRAVKAAFEWAAAYDLTMDTRYLLIEIAEQDTFDTFLEKVIAQVDIRVENDGNARFILGTLPFRNGFLRVRDREMTYAAAGDLRKATAGLDGSFAAMYSRFSADAKAKYAWLQGDGGFIRRFGSALASGGIFYFPELEKYQTLFEAMEGQGSWIADASGSLGVDLGELFTPGALSASRIVATESGGTVPTFFGFALGSGTGTAISSAAEIARFDTFRLEFGQGFKSVFARIKGVDSSGYRWVSDIFPEIFPQSGIAPDLALEKANVSSLYGYYQER
jgi:hypothetical protein